jgi:hypothetical protein
MGQVAGTNNVDCQEWTRWTEADIREKLQEVNLGADPIERLLRDDWNKGTALPYLSKSDLDHLEFKGGQEAKLRLMFRNYRIPNSYLTPEIAEAVEACGPSATSPSPPLADAGDGRVHFGETAMQQSKPIGRSLAPLPPLQQASKKGAVA